MSIPTGSSNQVVIINPSPEEQFMGNWNKLERIMFWAAVVFMGMAFCYFLDSPIDPLR